jgi:UDP-N-acetylglucosamine 2-epimerase (non-hydrolysing)/GDP/UDP-N,N'-diacetylbacillosamine 2-epimerase (hydrolysing)
VDVGATGLDNIERLALLAPEALADALGIEISGRTLVSCTFHPETLSDLTPAQALEPLFAVLAADPRLVVVMTKANADAGGREINRLIDGFVAEHADRVAAFSSLGQLRYLSLVQAAQLVIGNSSSGIIEAPALGTPTVNIGDRQAGRLRAPSVIDVPNDEGAIRDAIDTALSPEFQQLAAARVTP